MRVLGKLWAGALVVAASAMPALADEYPSQPIEIITHASAGGGTDTTARALAAAAAKPLGTQVFVNIKQGGGGAVAMGYAKTQPEDGYHLMAITPTHLITMARGRAPVSIDDVKGVVRTTDDPIIVTVNAASGIKSIDELIEASKSSPIKWGGTQVGGIDHIAAMTFANKTGTKVSYVPFDGGGAMVTNLMGKNIQAAGLNYGEAADGIEAGDFVPLAIMAPKRMSSLPDVPTLAEEGFPGVNFSTVRGIIALKGVPDDRLAVAEKGFIEGMKTDQYQKYLTGIGLDGSSVAGSEEWDAQIREMYSNIETTLKSLGLAK
ncbi:Bug family tripartite tricarboxylate transporter substrate binding protein [Thioclava nitratireducens]|nr:tripartite tricarboxylate transporter substrate binding protein [Thioclava nitratireducens]